MIKIEIRQNSKGRWWCNTTYRCLDICEEGETIEEAILLISERLKKNGLPAEEIVWGKPQLYKNEQPLPKPQIGYAKWRVDKGMF